MDRRQLLRLAIAVPAGVIGTTLLSGCETAAPQAGPPAPADSSKGPGSRRRPRVLLAYFSRAGENYYYGDRTWLEVGYTKVVAGLIADLIHCDVYEITAADPYPDDYEECVDRNSREQEENARPAIANPLPQLGEYDAVLLGSPIWNVRTPMIMSTFTEALDFTGKTVHPFVTYAVSGLGTTVEDYTNTCAGATIGAALAVRGEQAPEARPDVAKWLPRVELSPGR
jgi:flavodoxin